MAKKKLIWYPGAMYHVTSRGNRRSDIFKDEEDYLVYLANLKVARRPKGPPRTPGGREQTVNECEKTL